MKIRRGVAYKQLKQSKHLSDSDDSDDEDLHGSDDDVLFDRGSKGRLLVKENEKLGEHVKLKMMGKRPRKPKYKKSNAVPGIFKNMSCKMCVILSLSLIFIGSAVTIPVLHWHKIGGGGGGTVVNVEDWSLLYNDAATESVIRLLDVDNDGKDDLLIGIVEFVSRENKSSAHTLDVIDDFKGIVIAVRGYDGKELWRTEKFGSSILFMNCHDIDVNNDSRIDCIVTGRNATIVAIDVTNGDILWRSKSEKHYRPTWNIYQVSALPDFTSDGIQELLVTHGGDPKAEPEDHKRESGRLILISGRDGKPLGKFYKLPQFKETYMTSVIYTRSLGDQYILYGTGGETVPGALLGISVPDFYRKVMDRKPDSPVPSVNISLYSSIPLEKKEGVMKLISGMKKGVMVPPIIVDVNNDGVADILVSLFDGKLVLLDGKTLDKKWTAEFPNFEFYSTPAPGYFDEDDYLDFMFHVSQGAWMDYNYTRHVVISGNDGTILWEMVSNGYDMSSDLVVKTTQHCDLFIFRMIGRKKSAYSINDKTGNIVHHLQDRTENISEPENISETKPNISETKPNISETKPKISEAKPKISETKPNISETTPHISETKPNISETKPNISEAKPKISETKPNISETTPHISETKPNISETKPNISETKPNISETKLNISEAKPNISETKPSISKTKPNISKAKPNISEAKPNISEAKPNISETKPNISETKPSISKTTPNISKTTPNISETKPNISKTTPNISKTTPNISETKPNISETTPNISEIIPDIGETKPNIGGTTPNIGGTTPNISETKPNISETTPNISMTKPNISETTPNISGTTPDLNKATGNMRPKRHEYIEVTNEIYNLTAAECLDRKKDYEKHHITCGQDSVKLDQEIFIVGRATNYQPIKVLDAKATEYKYDVENKQCGTLGEHRTQCILAIPDGRLTGAVGNLDGYGNLQLVAQILYNAHMVDDSYELRKQKLFTKLQRVDLRRVLETGIRINSKIYMKIKPKHQKSSDVHFLPKEKQRWLEYLGSNNDNVY
ncbi:uncharacterized protein LOC126810645 [Patella vulgata]|uniref:uncharacterized protein LOC126810645 n=1 Tax=Patella vulgata TaxID=6465 RepID=UPI0024A8534C|nr:uncharacterized protein LOC126810645 [Patella vulgata]XP_055955219.1 uncharacterized protein LOC126810645 [Patella vulgata]